MFWCWCRLCGRCRTHSLNSSRARLDDEGPSRQQAAPSGTVVFSGCVCVHVLGVHSHCALLTAQPHGCDILCPRTSAYVMLLFDVTRSNAQRYQMTSFVFVTAPLIPRSESNCAETPRTRRGAFCPSPHRSLFNSLLVSQSTATRLLKAAAPNRFIVFCTGIAPLILPSWSHGRLCIRFGYALLRASQTRHRRRDDPLYPQCPTSSVL